MRRSDVIVGAIVTALGAYALVGALGLAFFFNNAPGPGFLPAFLSGLLLILGLLLVANGLRARTKLAGPGRTGRPGPGLASQPAPGLADPPGPARADQAANAVAAGAGPDDQRVRRPELLRVAGVAGGWILSAVVIGTLGFVPTMVLLVLYLSMLIEGKRGWRPVVAAILIPVAAYFAFGKFLQVQLPIGPLGY